MGLCSEPPAVMHVFVERAGSFVSSLRVTVFALKFAVALSILDDT